MANSVDPDERPHFAASHLGLNCLLRPVCPNTYGKYGILKIYIWGGILSVLQSEISIYGKASVEP